MNPLARPVTYRMLKIDSKTPDAPVSCNCKFDQGHEGHCDIVAANAYLKWLSDNPGCIPPHIDRLYQLVESMSCQIQELEEKVRVLISK